MPHTRLKFIWEVLNLNLNLTSLHRSTSVDQVNQTKTRRPAISLGAVLGVVHGSQVVTSRQCRILSFAILSRVQCLEPRNLLVSTASISVTPYNVSSVRYECHAHVRINVWPDHHAVWLSPL